MRGRFGWLLGGVLVFFLVVVCVYQGATPHELPIRVGMSRGEVFRLHGYGYGRTPEPHAKSTDMYPLGDDGFGYVHYLYVNYGSAAPSIPGGRAIAEDDWMQSEDDRVISVEDRAYPPQWLYRIQQCFGF